ncbi:hypothetical protein F511_22301 [Dorcoceras hygrometricum]|uniref:EamA domain-containing protein n=1 Tax=Dorcoceras hygrometricum TaxID=472368 RepID=A0A2Z7DG29_9LAMI|nr:hypothetical protein F511_22301 [Dorcoceras hygrometricum]
MPPYLTWKTHLSSASVPTIRSNFHSCCGHQKIIHLTIVSSSKSPLFSEINGGNLSQVTISGSFTEKALRNGRFRQELAANKSSVSAMERRHFRKKSVLGSKKFGSIILLHVITIIYASNISIIKDAESFTDPAYFSAVRFVLSTIPFLPSIFQARNDIQTRNSGLELGLWVGLGYLSEAVGLLTSDAGRASFISLFTVIIIPVLESVLGVMIPARTWFGILMSVLGISMLECCGSPPKIGDLFNFLSAIFFGIHTLRTKHISRTVGEEKFSALLGYEVGVVAVLSTIWCLVAASFDHAQDSEGISWTWELFFDWIYAFPWVPALYTGVFSTVIGLWGEIAAMREISATETAVIYGLEPVWGAGFAWLLLGERWEAAGWIGAALVLGGSLMVQVFGAGGGESEDTNDGEKATISHYTNHQKTMSASPIMATSRNKYLTDIFKK